MFLTISLLLAAACLLPAAGKLTGQPKMRQSAAHFGIPWPRYQLIGATELAAAASALTGLWWHPLGVAAAAGMALLLLSALIAHRRAADSGKEMAPALLALAITICRSAPGLPGANCCARVGACRAGEAGSLSRPVGGRPRPDTGPDGGLRWSDW